MHTRTICTHTHTNSDQFYCEYSFSFFAAQNAELLADSHIGHVHDAGTYLKRRNIHTIVQNVKRVNFRICHGTPILCQFSLCSCLVKK